MLTNQRLLGLDIVKGLAVVLMIIYHFFFDLHYFRYLDIDFFTPFWLGFRYVIVTLFLLSVGVSLTLAHPLKINFSKVFKRVLLLGVAALLVSVMSYYLFPNSWIYFGILHFIWLTSIVVLPVLFYPKIALVLAVSILCAYWLGVDDTLWLLNLKPILSLPSASQDFVPIFPWLAVVLLAVASARLGWHLPIFGQKIWTHKTSAHKTLAFLGKYALWVYLAHQPILFAGFYLVEAL